MPVQTQLQIRRDTATNWSSTNPTLASGEWGLETDTRQYKIGDGVTAWNSLGYQLGPLLDEDIATDPNGAYFTGSGLQMYGTATNFATSPDSNALDITGDIDIRAKLSLDDWTPITTGYIIAKWGASGSRSYDFFVRTDGKIQLRGTTDGTSTLVGATSSVATGFTDGETKWIRATRVASTGTCQFFTSDDGTNWIQLGTDVSGTSGNIFASTTILELGMNNGVGGQTPIKGTFYRAQILNGINGTVAFDANFETVPADSFAFTESSANAATVTLATTRYSFGLPGATLTGTTTGSLVLNNTYYNGFSVKNKPITIKHIAFECTTVPSSNSNVRIGIYAADANMQPTGNIVYSSDAISVLSAAAAIYRIRVTPFVLNPGNYVIGLNPSQTFTIRQYTGGMAFASNTLGANLQRYYQVTASLSGAALPTTGTKWNAKNAAANTAVLNLVILGWS